MKNNPCGVSDDDEPTSSKSCALCTARTAGKSNSSDAQRLISCPQYYLLQIKMALTNKLKRKMRIPIVPEHVVVQHDTSIATLHFQEVVWAAGRPFAPG
jgi:hypothetical protein